MIRIYVKGIHGYGVDYGCCDIFSNQEYCEVTIDKFGNGWNLLLYCIILICLIVAYIFESKKEKDDDTKND